MKEYQSIFKRYEKKYIVSYDQRERLLDLAGAHIKKDKYFKGTICSIYYDTPSSLIIRNSLEKSVYKEKIRLRSYGVPGNDDEVFLEIKKKYEGIVYKRRTSLRLYEAEDFFKGTREPHSQIEKELMWSIEHYDGIHPAMYISYDRISFCGTEDSTFRLTFDTNVTYRNTSLSLSDGIWGERLLESGMYIMEVKSPYAIPLWLADGLEEMKIYPSSFSKYGTAYQICSVNETPTKTSAEKVSYIEQPKLVLA